MTRLRIVPLLLVVACAGGEPEPATPINNSPASIAEATFADTLQINLADYTVSPTGLYWRDLRVGEGAEVTSGAMISAHYDGYLPDGTLFESSRGGAPITFPVGRGAVIDGWEEGLLGMRVGGDRRLIIPPTLAYGAAGSPPAIPPNATLIFTVTAVEVQ